MGVALGLIGSWWAVNGVWFQWSADSVGIIRVVEEFSKHGQFPVRGILSSVAAYNFPGLVWLLLPASLLFDDPRWIAVATATPLNLAAAAMLYHIAKRVMGGVAAWGCMILYCFLPPAVYFASSLWAFSYLPAFYLALFLLMMGWAVERRPWLGAAAIVVIVYAAMIHFSALVFGGLWAIVWVLWRAPVRWRSMAVAAAVCAALLAPYSYFETSRGFRDFKAFVTGKSLLREWPTLSEEAAMSGHSRLYCAVRPWAWRAIGTPQGAARLMIANFLPGFDKGRRPQEYPYAVLLPALGALFLGGFFSAAFLRIRNLRRSLASNGRSSSAMSWIRGFEGLAPCEQAWWLLLLLLSTAVAGFAFMGYGQRASFAWALLPFQCVVACWAAVAAARRLVPHVRIRTGLLACGLALFVAGSALASAARIAGFPDARHGESRFLQERIADFIIEDMKRDGLKDLSISYDFLPEAGVFAFVPRYHEIDPMYHIGMEFDYFFERHPDIARPTPAVDGLRPGARYVVLFQGGEKRYDLSRYGRHDFGRYAVLIRRDVAGR